MNFQSVVPILYASDVNASIRYFVEVLGFTGSWTWDDTPTFGGVDKAGVRLFFCKDGQGSPGTWLAINVDDIDAYYEFIKSRGATILDGPHSYEWGMREMTVEAPDGHKIRFGQGISVHVHENADKTETIKIVERLPTPLELKALMLAVGWVKPEHPVPAEIPPQAIAYALVAEEKSAGIVVGCAFLLGDGAGFYYVKNVIVHPQWQGSGIGSLIMHQLNNWLEANITDNATVYLHTGDHLAPFYRQFGFLPCFSMQKNLKKETSTKDERK